MLLGLEKHPFSFLAFLRQRNRVYEGEAHALERLPGVGHIQQRVLILASVYGDAAYGEQRHQVASHSQGHAAEVAPDFAFGAAQVGRIDLEIAG